MTNLGKNLIFLTLFSATTACWAMQPVPAINELPKNNNASKSSASSSGARVYIDGKNASATTNDLSDFSPTAYKAKEIYQTVTAHAIGENHERVYVFLPSSPAPKNPIPTVFLHHGWLGTSPLNFGALIDYLVRTGHAVIYPVYQKDDSTSPQTITANAVTANNNAVAFIQKQGLQIDTDRVLYVGFSMGANIASNIATHPIHFGLPAPKGLVLLATGDAHHVKHGKEGQSTLPNFSKLPINLPTIIMTGEADTQIGVPTSHKIAKAICHLPSDKRVFLTLPSDSHDGKTVKSGHGSVGAPDSRYDFSLDDHNFPKTIIRKDTFEPSVSLNNLDFYGYWRAISLLDDSLTKANPVVLGANQTGKISLGAWEDGTPFAKMNIINHCK